MEVQFESLIGQITDFMEAEAKTETVVGEPFQLGDFSCIPVIRVGMGFGTGGGEGEEGKGGSHGEGLGVGAGMGIEPIGFLAANNNQIQFIPTRTNKGLAAAFEKVPELIERYMEATAKNKSEAITA